MLILFALTALLSACLLFLIQPMIGKMVLPMLGGAPLVWNTCMVFFQAMLLAGYAYAHASTSWLAVRRQAALHAALLFLPFLTLPFYIPERWQPPSDGNPAPWLLLVLLISVGLPFFAVSTSAPLLQKWFASTAHRSARDPYFLYAASNIGSVAALLLYPTLVEPNLRLEQQRWFWAVGYGVFVALSLCCAVMLWRSPIAGSQRAEPSGDSGQDLQAATGSERKPSWAQRMRWLALAFVPSSLMLGLTTHITTDIVAIPFLWIIPLTMYLLTFILVFARRRILSHGLMVESFPVIMLFLVSTIAFRSVGPFWVLIATHLLAFFVTAMVCHGELARTRPTTAHLTEFYLLMAIGGVLGGLFNALIAPLVFKVPLEYPIAMVLACLIWPRAVRGAEMKRSRTLDIVLPLTLAFLLLTIAWTLEASEVGLTPTILYAVFGPSIIVCYSFSYRPIRFGLGIGAVILASILTAGGVGRALYIERSFFGVHRIANQVARQSGEEYLWLYNGTTVHGFQSLDPARRHEPLAYYYRTGPVGQVFAAFSGVDSKHRIAVVGLGAGSLACYGEPGQEMTFYEIDPAVERIARNSEYFTFLQDCRARLQVIHGDARLSLRKALDGWYDLIILDAFSSDAIPLHLITREAVGLYLSKLSNGGLLVFHTSNRYLDLHPVLGDLAENLGLVCLSQKDLSISEDEQKLGKMPSTWIVMARTPEDLGKIKDDERWTIISGIPGSRLWTDDFSNIFSVVNFQ